MCLYIVNLQGSSTQALEILYLKYCFDMDARKSILLSSTYMKEMSSSLTDWMLMFSVMLRTRFTHAICLEEINII